MNASVPVFAALCFFALAFGCPQSSPPDPFNVVEVHPDSGNLRDLLREHSRRAEALNLKPFVELTADWCEPCQRLHQGMSEAKMVEAFRGTYIIRVDTDLWGKDVGLAGMRSRSIPAFHALSPSGLAVGRSIDGESWTDTTSEVISPILGRFFMNQ